MKATTRWREAAACANTMNIYTSGFEMTLAASFRRNNIQSKCLLIRLMMPTGLLNEYIFRRLGKLAAEQRSLLLRHFDALERASLMILQVYALFSSACRIDYYCCRSFSHAPTQNKTSATLLLKRLTLITASLPFAFTIT